ncbi:TetR/AcrR family transcriptional regulator [Streptomyces sp. NPDC002514]|uniref:TetR/AcrR family transcriptional regulator n=1 Tax=Streptomyces sp. NPDC001270 TaxID=3364554 RepID=UPI0036AC372B
MRVTKDSRATRRREPSTEQGRRTRAAIVAAAGQLMYERGVAATSLDDVLNACGAGKSQLYHYFGGKQELVAAVIDHQLRGILANQPRLEHLQSWADFDGWAADLLALQAGPAGTAACPLGSLAGELDDDPDLHQELDAAFRTWESFLAGGLDRLRERGLLRADADPARLAAATMAALQGGLMLAHLRRDITPLQDALTMALAHLRSHRP